MTGPSANLSICPSWPGVSRPSTPFLESVR